MGSILAPDARKPPSKNFHKENLQKVQRMELEAQQKRESDTRSIHEQ